MTDTNLQTLLKDADKQWYKTQNPTLAVSIDKKLSQRQWRRHYKRAMLSGVIAFCSLIIGAVIFMSGAQAVLGPGFYAYWSLICIGMLCIWLS